MRFKQPWQSTKDAVKDWLALIGMVLLVVAILGWGAYNVWLDVQWKRAVIQQLK